VILVMIDTDTGYPMAVQVPRKGAEQYSVSMGQNLLDDCGANTVNLRTDGENPIKAWAKAVKNKRTKVTNLQETPRYSHSSNGAVEQTVQIVQHKIRALKLEVDEKYGIKVGPTHVLLGWMIRHASWLIARFQDKKNSMTSYMIRNGTTYKGDLVPFGESVLFRDPVERGSKGKISAKWMKGIWVGRAERNNEHLLLTPDGLKKARTIRRRIPSQAYDKEYLHQCFGRPWEPGEKSLSRLLEDRVAHLPPPQDGATEVSKLHDDKEENDKRKPIEPGELIDLDNPIRVDD
jgi:hypothetical protein